MLDSFLTTISVIIFVLIIVFCAYGLYRRKNLKLQIKLAEFDTRKGKLQRFYIVLGLIPLSILMYLFRYDQTGSQFYAVLGAIIPLAVGVMIGFFARRKS